MVDPKCNVTQYTVGISDPVVPKLFVLFLLNCGLKSQLVKFPLPYIPLTPGDKGLIKVKFFLHLGPMCEVFSTIQHMRCYLF